MSNINSLLVEISTLSQLITVNALLDSGHIDYDYAILLISDNTKRVEAYSSVISQLSTFEELTKKFSRVVILNELIYPRHPSRLNLEEENLNSIQYLKRLIGVEFAKHLLLESIQVPPASFLASIYSEANISVYADGLMVYAPLRNAQHPDILRRIKNVYYFDFIKSVKPLLLQEYSPAYIPISLNSYKRILENKIQIIPLEKKNIIIAGQYISDLGFCTPSEEENMYINILENEFSINGNLYNYIFKPHPSSTISGFHNIEKYAKINDIPLYIDDSPYPLEFSYSDKNTYKVCGLFSSALFTLSWLYNIKARSYFCDDIYNRIYPFINSNRIPIMLSQIMFDINYKNIVFDKEDVCFFMLLNSLITSNSLAKFYHKCTYKFLYDKAIACYSEKYPYNFIHKPIKIINGNIKIKMPPPYSEKMMAVQTKLSGISFNGLLDLAEKYIEIKNYNLARAYFIQALTLRPGNTNCLKRLIAVSSNKLIRWIMLKLTDKYKIKADR